MDRWLSFIIAVVALSSQYEASVHKDTQVSYTHFPSEAPALFIVLGGEEYSATSLIFSMGPYKIQNTILPNEYTWNDIGSLLFIDTTCGYSKEYSLESIYNFIHYSNYYKGKSVYVVALGTGTELALALADMITQKPIKDLSLKGIILGGPTLESAIELKAKPVYAYAYDIIETDIRNYIATLYKMCLSGIRKGSNKFIRSICTLADNETLGPKSYNAYINNIERNIDAMSPLIKQSHPKLIKEGYSQCKISQLIYEQSNANSIIDLAQKGIPSLLYFGDKDFFTTWYGGYEVVSKLWQESTDDEDSLNMKMKGKQICSLRIKNGITFAKVTNAGHYVDVDAPHELHILVKDWVKKHL